MDRTGKLAVHRTTLSDNAFGPCEPRWLVIDAKYKDPLRGTWGKQYFHNEDLYQAFTTRPHSMRLRCLCIREWTRMLM